MIIKKQCCFRIHRYSAKSNVIFKMPGAERTNCIYFHLNIHSLPFDNSSNSRQYSAYPPLMSVVSLER